MKLPAKKYQVIVAAILIVAGLCLYAFFETYWLKITRIDFKDSDIPAAFVGKRIVFLSDLQLGFYFSEERTKKLVEKVNSLNPDVVILGGDLIDRSQKYTNSRLSELKQLKAPLGKFAVLGNHDNAVGPDLIKKELREDGIILLENQGEWLWATSTNSGLATSTAGAYEKIKIGGVGDLWTATQDLMPTLAGVSQDDFVVLTSHDPDYVYKFSNDLIDLMLSGHTHAGQITLFGLYGFTPRRSSHNQKLRYGLVDMGHTKIYVTSGVGTTILPLRFFARPEIVLITLKK